MPCLYKVIKDHPRNSYIFGTSGGAKYEVVFLRADSIFTGTMLESSDVYSVSISKISAGDGRKDPEMKLTFSAILSHFFAEDQDRILIYSYDHEGGRAITRKRLFNIWSCNSTLLNEVGRFEDTLSSTDGDYHVGLLYDKSNSNGHKNIERSFLQVAYYLSDK